MRGRTGRRVARMVGGLAGLLLLAACAAPGGEPTSLPTFPAPAADVRQGAAGDPDEGRLPGDCGRLLAPADLGALLGLPLDSVTVRSTIGVPAPAVGRTERLACRYTGSPDSSTLLDLNVGAYVDADSARNQWRVNADAEDGDPVEYTLGAASAVLVERPAEAVLMVVNADVTLTLVLPERARPGQRTARQTLLDLALRVLPAVTPAGAPRPTQPAVAVGTR